MGTTTKSIVKEIKKSQEKLAEDLNKLSELQKEYAVSIDRQIAAINERITHIENKKQDEQELAQTNHIEILNSLNEIHRLIQNLENNIFKHMSEDLQQINQHTLSSANHETETISEKLHLSTEKICGIIEGHAGKSEKFLQDGIQQLKDNSIADVDKNTRSIIKRFNLGLEHVEKIVQDNYKETVESTEENHSKLSTEIQSVKKELHTMASSTESKDSFFTENICSMNLAIQEIMKSLLSLDEGNRLVIAKLLLKDLGN